MKKNLLPKILRIFSVFLLLGNSAITPLANVAGEDTEAPIAVSENVVLVNDDTSDTESEEALEVDDSEGTVDDATQESGSEPSQEENVENEETLEEENNIEDEVEVIESDTTDGESGEENVLDEESDEPTISDLSLRNEESSIKADGIVVADENTIEESSNQEENQEGIEAVLFQRSAALNQEENNEPEVSQLLTTGTPSASCTEPDLSPVPLKVHQFMTVTCNGENIGMRQLQVKQGNNLIMTTGKKTGNTFNYSPAFAGTFTFECRGWAAAGATGDPVCGTTATVEDADVVAECYEPTVNGNFAIGETVQVTCNGNNIASYQLVVDGPNGTTTTPKSTNPNFSYTPAQYGNYTFTCLGRPKAGVSGETSCSTSASIDNQEEAVCREPALKTKEINKGELFEITCQGDNLMKHQLKVQTPSGQTVTLPQSTNPKFTYQGNQVGTYTFTCLGRAQQGYVGETSCSTTGKVKEEQKAVCRDPKLQNQEIKIGESFQVSCEGDNIGSHMLTVYKAGSSQPVYTSSKQSSSSFTYKPTSVGSYTFVCNGRPKPGYTGETECRTTGKVVDVPATCTESVTPTYVNQGGTFTITCQGANIDTYHLSVKQGSQTIFTQDKVDTNDDDQEVFTYQGNQAGTYTFVCEGTPENSGNNCTDTGGDTGDRRNNRFDTGLSRFTGGSRSGGAAPTAPSTTQGSCTSPTKVLCGSIDRVVKPICVDPVTSVTVTSHQNLQEVSNQQVTVQGTFVGDVDTVEVKVNNGASIQATVNKTTKTWSATVLLTEGTNFISVTGLSDDPLCGSKQTTLKLVYVPQNVCIAPIAIKITSHSQLNDSDQLNNIITTSTTPVSVFGTYTGSLQTLMVVVDYADGTSTTFNATVNAAAKTWSASIPVKQGTSNVWIKGISSQHEECNYLTDFIIKYQPEEPVACESPIVTPDVSVEVGEDFTVTCRGTNVGAFKMTVKKGEQVVNQQTKTDTNDDDRETFTWNGTPAGQYTIHCDASTESNPTVFVKYCGAKTRVVTEKPFCVDPVTSIAITSHTNEQTVSSNQVTIGGTFSGDVDTVEVRVNNGAVINATVNKNNKTRSTTITLIEGINRISAKGISDDPLCGSKQTTLKLHYQEEDVCRDPITVKVTNIPQLADNDQLNNIVNTSTSPIVLQGTYSGSVQSIMVVVDHASGGSSTYTALLNPSAKTRSLNLPVQSGRSNVRIKGVSYQHEECNYLDDFIVNYYPEEPVSCESPIVTPDVSVEVDEDFTITCRGTNVGGFKMSIKKGNQIVNEQTATDTNDDDRETFTRTGTSEGTYTIHCDASTENAPTTYVKYCGAKTRIVNEKEPFCEDPVTSIAITSHTNDQTVSSNQVTISGTFSGDVDTVEVRVNNGGVINGTLNKNNKTRSATITLIEGINRISVKGISDDPLCGSKQTTLKLQYQEEDVCRDPITVKVTNIPQLADNDQTNNIVTMSGTSLFVQGTYEGSVQSIMIVVDANNGSTTYNAALNAGNKTRSVTIPVQAGTSNVRIKGVSYQHEECNYLDDFVIKYLPEEPLSCVSPIVTPDVSVYVDEDFTVTCLGENAGGFKMTVKKGDQIVDVQSRADADDNDREIFTWTGATEGQYTIHCDASTESNPTQYIKYCGAKTRIVYEREPECVDPVTSLTLTSHTYGQVVNTGNVVISGAVVGGIDRVEVVVGSSVIQATRNGSTWSATIPVTGSGTAFTVRAVPNDEDCDTRVVNGLLNVAEQPKKSDPAIDIVCDYNSSISCSDTMRCTAYIVNTTGAQAPAENLQAYLDLIAGNTIVSTGLVVQALQNDNLTCQVTQNDQIACTGRLNIGSQATVSFDVQLASCPCEGSNRFVYEGRVQASNGDLNLANNYDTRTQNITSDQECGGNICENPLTLVVDAPVNNTDTRSSSVEVRGTVTGSGAVVRVNNSIITITSGGAFSTNVSLGIGNNTITVTANNNDPECAQQITRVVDRDSGGGRGGNGRKSTITCGNDRVERSRGEECDDGNTRSGDGCSSSCQLEDNERECGNGIVELNEQCDDGNNRNGDGCDSTCDLEDDEIKKKVKKVKIEEILTERRRPDPLPLPLPSMPPVLPKTGSVKRDIPKLPGIAVWSSFRSN